MIHHNTEAVTGLLDGELKGLRRWMVQRHVNRCSACAEEYRRQEQVRQLLRANPTVMPMSDSPGFFWSKVKAEIQRRGDERVAVPTPHLAFIDWLGQHQLAVATAAAALIAVVGVLWFMPAFRGTTTVAASVPTTHHFALIEHLKTPVPHTVATAFDNEDADVTVIWVTGLPWTPDMNGMKTEFANLDT
jgi:predicted anti-sigma-YlaC factor YlaD